MTKPSRREVLQLVSAAGAAAPHLQCIAAAAPRDAVSLRISRYELLPVRDPFAQAAAIAAVVPKDFKIWADANAWWDASNPWREQSAWHGVDGALHVTRKLAEFPNFFGDAGGNFADEIASGSGHMLSGRSNRHRAF